MFYIRPVAAACLFMTAIFTSAPASAALVYSFKGIISGRPPAELSSQFSLDDTFFGTFTIDETIADSDSNPNGGRYRRAVTQFSVFYSNGFSTSFINPGYIITKNSFRNGFDLFQVHARVSGLPVSGNILESLNFIFRGPATLLLDDSITSIIAFEDFSVQRDLVISFSKPDRRGVTLSAPFTELSLVPLPAALPLFAAGLGVIGLLGRWRKRAAA